MQTKELILAQELCTHYKVEYSFINSLQQFGLVEITEIDAASYIPQNQLQRLEQLIRLHYDLDINLEGIDAIAHLLEKVRHMQDEIAVLKTRLKLYEDLNNL